MNSQEMAFTPIPKGSSINSNLDRNKQTYQSISKGNLVFNNRMYYQGRTNSYYKRDKKMQYSNYNQYDNGNMYSSYNGNYGYNEMDIHSTQMKQNDINNNRRGNDNYYYLNKKSNFRKFLDVLFNF